MANKKVSQLTSKPSVLTTDLFPIADPSTGQLFKTTISDLGTAIGSGVSSVNTLVGAVVLDTDDIQELVSPTNKWFTDTRARAAISAGTGISYNSGTGVITNAVTSGQIATALGYTPANGANYLALAGGTMGGAITGTTATFESSSSATALGITLSGSTGDGIKINHSAGRAFNIQSSGGGFGILINNETSSTSVPFTIQKQGASVIELTDAGAGVFASSLSALSFVKSGGTSAQFLKADGSVDSSTYLTTGTASSTYVALTGNQTIAGQKTFSSSLYGTSGVFSGQISATVGNINGDNSTNALYITHNSSFNTLVVVQSGAGAAIYADGKIFANQFIKIGGSSTDFLKGDGSVDTNTYLTTSSASSSYLPLAGGTLTGALSGTSASFSSSVTATGFVNTAQTAFLLSSGNNNDFRFNSSSDVLRVINAANNYAIMTVLNSGLVGIGTTDPTRSFQITRTSTAFINAEGSVVSIGSSDTELRLFGNNVETMTLKSGNVAIGTTGSPWYLFTALDIGTNAALANYTDYTALASNVYYASSGNWTFKTTGYGSALYMRKDDGNIYFSTFGTGSAGATATGSERMRITSDGIIQISTTASIPTTNNSIYSYSGNNLMYIQGGSAGLGLSASGSRNNIIYVSESSNYVRFDTSGSERMRITSGGNVLINGTAINDSASLGFGKDGAGIYQYINRSVTSGAYQIEFRNPNGLVGYISTSGSTTTYSTSSDYRLKQDFKSFNGLNLLEKIKAYDYEWKVDNTRSFGVIAHELAEVLPYAVMGEKDGERMQGVDYSKIVPVMVQAIKELKAELDTLKNK